MTEAAIRASIVRAKAEVVEQMLTAISTLPCRPWKTSPPTPIGSRLASRTSAVPWKRSSTSVVIS